MSQLHTYYALKDARAFRQLLESRASTAAATAPGSSGPKSWTMLSSMGTDVNARDAFGRTVLHLASGNIESYALEYVRILLAQQHINVNAVDTESQWTPLHRALYVGNLQAARLLLERADTDLNIKDADGFTAFDVYNSTVEGTAPRSDAPAGTSLFTWGVNRNAALGLGDGDDRTFPELVNLKRHDNDPILAQSGSAKFAPIKIKSIVMSRLHTAVITDEARSNIRLCGFGSGGRLGGHQHTQYSFSQVQNFPHNITSVALGQDHTLALTVAGEVLSWGLNRFSQLGYVVEPTPGEKFSANEEPIQYSAKKIIGPFRGKTVLGIAACKTASAAWMTDGLYTWGTNGGQLGYDKAAQQVQVMPRKVTAVTQAVHGVALSDVAMCCLLDSSDVLCFWNDTHFKINFPAQKFRNEASVYRPPQTVSRVMISKIVNCENSFAALSTFGDVFFFTVPGPAEVESQLGKDGEKFSVKPQRVWALRNAESAVTDVALGADGTIILCTQSGHVFIRTRNTKPANEGRRSLPGQSGPGPGNLKSFKFRRVPWLQRVVKVCANSTGAFGIITVDAVPGMIPVVGSTIGSDLVKQQPLLRQLTESGSPVAIMSLATDVLPVATEEDEVDIIFETAEMKVATQLCDVMTGLQQLKISQVTRNGPAVSSTPRQLWGADIFFDVGGHQIYAHQTVLACRSPVFRHVLSGQAYSGRELAVFQRTSAKQMMSLHLKLLGRSGSIVQEVHDLPLAFHPMSVLLLLHYLYADDVPSLWDRRVGEPVLIKYPHLKIHLSRLKAELLLLAQELELPALAIFLTSHSRRLPLPTLAKDTQELFVDSQAVPKAGSKPKYDVAIQLADKEVFCHSVILRARSPFFAAMFDEEEWMAARWTNDHIVHIKMGHLHWNVMKLVFRHIYSDVSVEMFEDVRKDTLEEYIDFTFQIMAAASELLLDKLMLICSSVIVRHVSFHNVPSLLADAAHYSAKLLVDSLCGYIAATLEGIMEARMLDDTAFDVLEKVAIFLRGLQMKASPTARSGILVESAMITHAEWLAVEDFPQPILRSWKKMVKASPHLSPVNTNYPRTSPAMRPLRSPRSPHLVAPEVKNAVNLPDDGIFAMDDDISSIPQLSLDASGSGASTPYLPGSITPNKSAVWKAKTLQVNQKSDMRSIMAEEEASHVRPSLPSLPSTSKRALASPSSRPPLTSDPSVSGRSPSQSLLTMRMQAGPNAGLGLPAQTTAAPSSQVSGARPGLPHAGISVPSPGVSRPPQSATHPGTDPNRRGMTSQPSTPSAGPIASPFRQPPTKGPPLGPVIVPTRAVPSDSSSRRTRNQDAWAPAPILAPAQSPPTAGASFLAIQQQQKAEGIPWKQQKRSLLEIQEQEKARRDQERAHQEEKDFMRWWQQEEQRVKLEENGVGTSGSGRSRGRGRGRGRGADTSRGGGGPGREERKDRGRGKDRGKTSEAVSRQ